MSVKTKIRHAMACRYIIKEWAQYIEPYDFISFDRGLIY